MLRPTKDEDEEEGEEEKEVVSNSAVGDEPSKANAGSETPGTPRKRSVHFECDSDPENVENSQATSILDDSFDQVVDSNTSDDSSSLTTNHLGAAGGRDTSSFVVRVSTKISRLPRQQQRSAAKVDAGCGDDERTVETRDVANGSYLVAEEEDGQGPSDVIGRSNDLRDVSVGSDGVNLRDVSVGSGIIDTYDVSTETSNIPRFAF